MKSSRSPAGATLLLRPGSRCEAACGGWSQPWPRLQNMSSPQSPLQAALGLLWGFSTHAHLLSESRLPFPSLLSVCQQMLACLFSLLAQRRPQMLSLKRSGELFFSMNASSEVLPCLYGKALKCFSILRTVYVIELSVRQGMAAGSRARCARVGCRERAEVAQARL